MSCVPLLSHISLETDPPVPRPPPVIKEGYISWSVSRWLLEVAGCCEDSAAPRTSLWLIWLQADCCIPPQLSKGIHMSWNTHHFSLKLETESIHLQSKSCALSLKQHISKSSSFTLKANGLCLWFVSRFWQFHYCLASSLWTFVDKSVSSIQTTGDHTNQMVTKAIIRRFSAQHRAPLYNRCCSSNCQPSPATFCQPFEEYTLP